MRISANIAYKYWEYHSLLEELMQTVIIIRYDLNMRLDSTLDSAQLTEYVCIHKE